MEEQEIINRVANSVLQVFDLEDYYPEGERKSIDISEWLLEGFVLREKDFRATLKDHNWEQYKDSYVDLPAACCQKGNSGKHCRP